MFFDVKGFLEAVESLHLLREQREKVYLLLPLQNKVISELKKTERSIKLLSEGVRRLERYRRRKRPPEEKWKVRELKEMIRKGKERLSIYKRILFVWRCVGDGIAFIYQTKSSLKHLYLGHEGHPKQEPGFLSGKAGFEKEYISMAKGVELGVPVVLSDLTNTLRVGDICVLGGDEPIPIEIKSSTNRNSRTDRQFQHLEEVVSFLCSGFAKNYHGFELTKRIEVCHKEVSHRESINRCIEGAFREKGIKTLSPEPGLTYIAFASGQEEKFKEVMEEHSNSSIVIHLVCDERHLPSYPFLLSFTPYNSLLFSMGEVEVVVFIEMRVVESMIRDAGLFPRFLKDEDGELSLQIMHDENDIFKGAFRVNESYLLRLGTEFLSVRSFVNEQVDIASNFSLEGKDVVIDKGTSEKMKEWLEVESIN
ncbi:hypothetical protein BZG00_13985 [Salinivibrio kushneri]|uniref:Nuclease n=1 Tax=Salinivibrio kushneri TaxID=1908198 RepID=A0AB36JTQ3_9GAMM|nr:hypothetical protein [Salinivibrio kushneri]OOE38530.1 hypothetical protein BZG00_13985 [Salinivibrio kushneri]QCP02765.1 hypothetical protein FCN78_10410 [Salinivibrio kushneri]